MIAPLTLPPIDEAFSDGRLRKAQLKMLEMLKIIDAICNKYQLDYWLDAGTLLGAVRHQGFIPWDDDMDIGMPRESFEIFLKVAPSELPSHCWLQTSQSDPGFFNMATPLKIRDKHSFYVEKHESFKEPYVQGIFIDVFVYDRLPVDASQRKRSKWYAKKISRFLACKYSKTPMGHYASVYRLLSRFIPKALLEKKMNQLIAKSKESHSPYLGRGYQCVGKNFIPEEDIYPVRKAKFETEIFSIPQNAALFLTQQFGENYLTLPPEKERVMRHCVALVPECPE